MTVPPCQHRGPAVGDDRVECRSNRVLHAPAGIATLTFCAQVCRWADAPNLDLVALRAPLRETPPGRFECVHRGPVVRIGECDLCGLRGQAMKVHRCELLDVECTVHKQHSQVKACAPCEHRQGISAEMSTA